MSRIVKFIWAGNPHNIELPKGARNIFTKKNAALNALWYLRMFAGRGGEMFYATADRFLVVYQYSSRWFKFRVERGRIHAHGKSLKIRKDGDYLKDKRK